MATRNKIPLPPVEIPEDYLKFDKKQRNEFCINLIDDMLFKLEKQLPNEIDKINFLVKVLKSSQAGAVDTENYEAAAIIRDILERLDE